MYSLLRATRCWACSPPPACRAAWLVSLFTGIGQGIASVASIVDRPGLRSFTIDFPAGFDVMQQSQARTTPGTLSVGKAHTRTAQRTVLVDEATRRALGERARFEPMGPVVFKGKSAAVEVFSLAPAQKV